MPCDLATVLKVKAGDAEAGGDLCRQLERFIRHLAKKAGLPAPSEDMVQEAHLAILEVLPRFDPERGASFETYSAPFIRAALRKANQEDEPLPGTGRYSPRHPETDPIELLIARESEYREPLDLSCLAGRQRLIVEKSFGLATKEQTPAQIASELRLTPRRVQQILQDALAQLRQSLPAPETE